jgi:1-deoxy-D-xylulose-5-phosphate synthase
MSASEQFHPMPNTAAAPHTAEGEPLTATPGIGDREPGSGVRVPNPESRIPNPDARPAEQADSQSHILETITSPADLRKLNIVELRRLAGEIRSLIIETVSRTGGHLAPSLGVVELTLALHYAFRTPEDLIIWDVGHQTYAHKIVTGRAGQFAGLRQAGGISGFPKRAESPYDVFDTGHAGDSLSVALGLAIADNLQGNRRKTIAVVGDGSIVTGMAFEALNNAGGLQTNLIVVLNDNEMSIAKSSGGFADYLNRIITGQSYNRMRNDVWNLLGRLPSNLGGRARLAARKVEEGLKNLVAPSVIFEELGFRYFGPFDGHNLISLIDSFKKIRDLSQPILVHVVTHKGKGYAPAEQHPEIFHGVGKFDVATGTPSPAGASYTRAFGKALLDLAERDPKVVAITAGMSLGTGLGAFSEKFPARFFDTGIAEQHAVAFAAGLALAGHRPVVAIYSTFLARAYDQIVQDVCLQNLPVVFAIDRAGVVGEDGPTHHGNLDMSYLRCAPNLTIMAPADETELKVMLEFALRPRTSPIAFRYPRGGSGGALPAVPPIEEGKGVVLREWTVNRQPQQKSEWSDRSDESDIPSVGDERRVAILAVGATVIPSLAAADLLKEKGIDALVANMRFVKPLDSGLLARVAESCHYVFTVEENTIVGGFGSAVLEGMMSSALRLTPSLLRIVRIALPDRFLPHAGRNRLLQEAGLDAASIAERIEKEIE